MEITDIWWEEMQIEKMEWKREKYLKSKWNQHFEKEWKNLVEGGAQRLKTTQKSHFLTKANDIHKKVLLGLKYLGNAKIIVFSQKANF